MKKIHHYLKAFILPGQFFLKGIASIVYVMLIVSNAAAQTVTPAQWLQQQTKPVFKQGHTLPLLGQMHCVNPPTDLRAELALNWGYAVRLSRPNGESALISLINSNPSKYKAATMIGNLGNMEGNTSINWPTGTFMRKSDGSLVDGRQIFSSEMPEAAFQFMINDALAQIAGQIQGSNQAPVTIENWTEYGLSVPANVSWYGGQDPKIVAAKNASGLSWQEYVSKRKAHYEELMRKAIKNKYPNCFYTAYTYGGFVGRPLTAGDWAWDYNYMKLGTDLPSPEMYYNYYNTGFVGSKDMLMAHLFSRAVELKEGSSYMYGWICAGYERDIATYQGDPGQGKYSDLPRWMGYLKMMYTAGMLGAITTGEFNCNVSYTSFNASSPPKWLDQMPVLSQAHALFSWLEPIVRNSTLLPGPNSHVWSSSTYTVPAYEFPTGFANTRVVARKVNNTNQWLICAWAADGVQRSVTVNIPTLGNYTLVARPEGTVRFVCSSGKDLWCDQNGMNPSLTASTLNFSCVTTDVHSFADQEQLSGITIYPNPANQNTTLSYQLAEDSKVKISIYDVVGKEIMQVLSENQSQGEHKLNLTAAQMPNGIYFVKMNSNGKEQTKKLVITK